MTKLANKTRLEDETLLKFAQGEGKPKRGEDLKIIYLIQSTFRLWPQQKDELGWKVETNGDFPQFLLQRGADDTFLSSIQTTAPLKCVGFRYFFHSLNNCIESFFFYTCSLFLSQADVTTAHLPIHSGRHKNGAGGLRIWHRWWILK